MTDLYLFNKPFGVISQFTELDGAASLANFISVPNIYPAGRLDKDSEGLLLLTNNGSLQHKISNPRNKMEKTYWAQVEGIPDQKAIDQLKQGIKLKDGLTLPAKARLIDENDILTQLWPRTPPIRYRAKIPTSWIELKIKQGKNRQVRRMTAAVGFPTLRLIRYSIGNWSVDKIRPGHYKHITV
ncbi:Ribosomal large subunit pseudouridine synthase E [hydrothermal vent metagenome]|uniref:Ribosomal large subunit pseudouridine synthase E n=1 Tax=hydrothermal vent metagenome TaxID=652676 RepID=A0A3B0ZRE0_9ZZZZ